MKILLVYPSHLNENGNTIKYKQGFLPPLALAQLAALTPKQHEVIIVNDAIEDIRTYYNKYFDLVGITAMTVQADRAYQIAHQFQRQGAKVVLGGAHSTFLTEEAKQYADAVIVGEAESVWEQVLDDAEVGFLEEFYHAPRPDLQQLIIPRWETCNLTNYFTLTGSKWPLMPLFTTRGCPFACKFCSVTHIHGRSYRFKPIENILQEINSIGAETYFFADDNIMASEAYSRELFHALQGKAAYWFSQASTTMLKHPELIDLAAKAGCFSLFIGIESISKNTLDSINKGFNKPEQYQELFDRLYRANIIPYVSLMFGFDEDTPDTFRQTLEFLKQNHIMLAMMWLLTPLPGTTLFKEMNATGRIIERQWSYYEGVNHVVFTPRNFSPQELKSLYWQTFRKFYAMNPEINPKIHEHYPSLPTGAYLGALSYQRYARMQVDEGVSPFSIGNGRI